MKTYLDFEKPIAELEGKIEELRHLAGQGDLNIADEVSKLQVKADRLLTQTYGKLTPWQKVLVARHPERPHFGDYVAGLIDDLVEIGMDILNPVQVTALGDTAALKARFGDKVVFWGGIDTQHVLPHGSAKDVETEVQQRIRDLGPNGGYVVASVHNIQPDVPPRNIMAMAEATRKFGTYPLDNSILVN